MNAELSVGVITDAAAVTPAWLTAVLQREGVLRGGRVERIAAEQDASNHARMVWLQVRYDAHAAPLEGLPERLVLKLCAGSAGQFDASEGALLPPRLHARARRLGISDITYAIAPWWAPRAPPRPRADHACGLSPALARTRAS